MKIATHYSRPAMVWRRSACHASSNCSQIQIASESRVRRLNVARRSWSCIANPIFSVPLLNLGSSIVGAGRGNGDLLARLSGLGEVPLFLHRQLRERVDRAFIGEHRDLLGADGAALLGCGVFLIEEFGAGEDFHGDIT